MPPVQQAALRAAASSVTVGSGQGWAAPTAGNLLVAVGGAEGGSGNLNTPPTGFTSFGLHAGSSIVAAVFCKTATGSETSVVLSSGSGSGTSLHLSEWTGFAVPTRDASIGNNATATPPTPFPTGTTSLTDGSGDLAIACAAMFSSQSSPSVDSGFTLLTTTARLIPAYKQLSGQATAGCSFTWTGSSAVATGLVVTISPAALLTRRRSGFMPFFT